MQKFIFKKKINVSMDFVRDKLFYCVTQEEIRKRGKSNHYLVAFIIIISSKE